jgi:hypothetical protein
MPRKIVLSVCGLLLVTAMSAFPCSVVCIHGYYACCNTNSCVCIKDGSPPPVGGCTHGGVGASACSFAGVALDAEQASKLDRFLTTLAEDERLSSAQTDALSQFLASLGDRGAPGAALLGYASGAGGATPWP